MYNTARKSIAGLARRGALRGFSAPGSGEVFEGEGVRVLAGELAADTSTASGGSLFHQVRSLLGSTRTELKDDAEDVPNMPRLSSSGTMGRRFYKKAHMKPAEDGSGYIVLLDNRELKTPARKPLKVPNTELALAIAAE